MLRPKRPGRQGSGRDIALRCPRSGWSMRSGQNVTGELRPYKSRPRRTPRTAQRAVPTNVMEFRLDSGFVSLVRWIRYRQ
jgi:hypothetical protein